MTASVFGPVAGMTLIALLGAGCTTAGAPSNSAEPAGWQAMTDDTYLCGPPACASLQRGGRDTISLGIAGQSIFDRNDQSTRNALEKALMSSAAQGAAGQDIALRIDGPVQRTMVGAHESLSFAMAGTGDGGVPSDPGHAVVVPKSGTFHLMFAFAATHEAARSAAWQLVNATSL